jgi:hypothetical protein
MANRDGDWGPWLGYRYDIDLNERWWHRLFKVFYFIVFGLVFTFFAFLAYDADPERRLENVEITGRLDEFLARTNPSVPNVIPGFMLLPGDTALLRPNGELDYLFSYNLEKSWCTPDAIRHLEATAEHLTQRAFGRTVETTEVLASIKKVSQDDAPQLCWFDSGMSEANMNEVVKFQFTPTAAWKAKAEFFFQVVGYSMLAHFTLANIYYRVGLHHCGAASEAESSAAYRRRLGRRVRGERVTVQFLMDLC